MNCAKGEAMFEIKENVGSVVAGDTQNLCKSIDAALLDSSALITSLIEGSAQSRLPIGVSQQLLQNATAGVNHLVSGRAEIAQTVKHLAKIQANSSLATTSYGCPDGVGASAFEQMPKDISVTESEKIKA